ncbi:MAG: hypothetical protein EPO39_19150 [Candidatus Manganitrophaceae bacterium]|nr:MAG: hypothetical protein EPO39_19150 [Candidatus Manganitrophaceae bacterium]
MIVLVPFGAVPGDLLDFLREELAYRFGEEVRIAEAEPIPEGAFDPKRNQHRSSLFLRHLEEERQDEDRQEIERRIGIVDVDLYNPESDRLLGETDPVDRVAVISLAALRSGTEGPEDPRFRARVLKEAVHEVGQTYGLAHCSHPMCVMFPSNTPPEIDLQTADFCLTHQSELKRS